MNDTIRRLLECFFSSDFNRITLQHVERDPDLRRWVDRLVQHKGATVLPLMTARNQVWWHAIARTEAEFLTLREGLEAFLGSTYADLTHARAVINTDNTVGAALFAYSSGRVLRFQADQEKIRPALNRMFALWDTRPSRNMRDTCAPGVIRRTFEMALQARDAESAREALATLRDSGTLSTANDTYLQVQYLSAFERWQDLLAMPELRDLIAIRRPPAVTDALLRAIFYLYLAPAILEISGGEAIKVMREQVLPIYRGLLEEHRGLRTDEAWTVVATAAAERGDSEILEMSLNILSKFGGVGADLVKRWLIDLRAEQSSDTNAEIAKLTPLEAAREALLQNDPASAIAYAAAAPNSPERVLLLLQAAVLLKTLEAARHALIAIDDLSGPTRHELLQRPLVRQYYEIIQPAEEARGDGALPPRSWKEWLDRLINDPSWPATEIRRTAELGVQEWTLESLLDAEPPDAVARRLAKIPDDRIGPFAETLPHLVDVIQADSAYPNPQMQPLYQALLEHLALTDIPTTSDVRVYVDLLPAVLEARLSAAAYTEVVDNFLVMLDAQRASPSSNVVLDLLDILVVHPCREPEARLRALSVAVDIQNRYGERWDNEDTTFLMRLGREIGAPDLVSGLVVEKPDQGHTDPLKNLAGKYVAIYTLTETISQRVRALITSAAPRVRVEVSHSHTGDERLKAMAQRADIFVMVTASAKHAATGFISAHRGSRPLLQPHGKGSASFLRTLRGYCEGLG